MPTDQQHRQCLLSNLCFGGFLATVRQPQPDGTFRPRPCTLFLGTSRMSRIEHPTSRDLRPWQYLHKATLQEQICNNLTFNKHSVLLYNEQKILGWDKTRETHTLLQDDLVLAITPWLLSTL